MHDLLGVGFARFLVVEIYPLMFASDPPELSPDFVLSPARTTQRDHSHIPFFGFVRHIVTYETMSAGSMVADRAVWFPRSPFLGFSVNRGRRTAGAQPPTRFRKAGLDVLAENNPI